MVKAIALHSVVPVRSEASECAGQESQLLFAETCTLLETDAKWMRIKNDADGVEGWVDSKMLTKMMDKEWKELSQSPSSAMVRVPMAYAVSINNGQTVPLSAGTHLPNYKDGQFTLLGVSFRIDPSMVIEQPLSMSESSFMEVTRFFLNTPYLWGGKNALGMDCSGFVQVIQGLFGNKLPRNASEQFQLGTTVELPDAQVGDLAFFDHQDGVISHVGIILDGERVIHCSGRVKVERLDATGIFSVENGNKYTHYLVGVKHLN